jgi:predicted transcriptional regulator/ribosome-associated translation inhibitor RaiA
MDLRDVAREPLILRHDDKVSHAISSIISVKSPEALVFRKGSLIGVLLSRELVKKRITDPSRVTIESFVRRIDALPASSSRGEIARAMLVNDYKAIPVVDEKGEMRILRKRDLLKLFLKEPSLKKARAGDVMRFPFCVSRDDDIATTRSIFNDMNVIAVPVVEENNRVIGLVTSTSLLKSVIEKQRPMRGEASGESFNTDSANVSVVMSPDIPMVDYGSSLRDVAVMITERDSGIVVVEKNGKMVGVITPGDILKTLSRDTQSVPVNITGVQQEDPVLREVMGSDIQSLLGKLSKMSDIDNFTLHVDRYRQEGRVKYSLKAKLVTRKGVFFSADHEWDITKALKGVLSKMEREFMKKREKSLF